MQSVSGVCGDGFSVLVVLVVLVVVFESAWLFGVGGVFTLSVSNGEGFLSSRQDLKTLSLFFYRI